MSSYAMIQHTPITTTQIVIHIQLRLVVDPALSLPVEEALQRARVTFGHAQCSICQQPIELFTHVSIRSGNRRSTIRGETFVTAGRGGSVCLAEGNIDVCYLVGTVGLTKFEHEVGHSLGIRHTRSPASPMFDQPGSSRGKLLTVADVREVFAQFTNFSHQRRPVFLTTARIPRMPGGSVTPQTPIANSFTATYC